MADGSRDGSSTSTSLPAVSHTETVKKQETLTQAKDRAQMTATTAMSIINVALLKEIVNRGPDGNIFYTPILVLVILSLIFQIVAGLLSIFVSGLRNYYRKYNDDMCDDLLAQFCCIKVNREKPKTTDEDYGCCPCECTTRLHADYEYKMLHDYENWCGEIIEKEIRASEAEVRLAELTRLVKQANEQLNTLKEEKDNNLLTEEQFREKYREVKATIKDAQDEREPMDKARTELNISHRKGQILYSRVDEMRRDEVLKQITFWQGTINYILYFVFIFNAFVAGLGALESGTGPQSGTATGAEARVTAANA